MNTELLLRIVGVISFVTFISTGTAQALYGFYINSYVKNNHKDVYDEFLMKGNFARFLKFMEFEFLDVRKLGKSVKAGRVLTDDHKLKSLLKTYIILITLMLVSFMLECVLSGYIWM